MLKDHNKSFIISYLAMRRLIGILGIALPVILVAGGLILDGTDIQGSISGYYYTNMRDFFVGLLCGVSLFLISYKGYEKIDNIIGTMSGVFALGIMFFPTSTFSGKVVKVGMFLIDDTVSQYIHLTFGALFFLSLSFNSIYLFTRRGPGGLSMEKKRRNIIYRTCGIVMVLAIVCIHIYMIFLMDTVIAKFNPVLILESLALFAFGISWLIKGNTLFMDKER